ncbi:MAG: prepilin peptidase [Turicibacter sp.]|jgi:leader peptidase (prepilin peptidase)/N-methyltransferase|uniref:Type 4 prepilin-like proteins leader peptide-processing enzyme n=1 Tax=Turicibacter faecis TaxID=2963365 RepID=A0ABM8IQU6_9FIRM|nr:MULTISPECIES: A24 family peptidase [unclassified Turicibacter]MCI8701923.1 prepilin peptidase [Turicibacter sp.]MCU7205562.1 prepilin peptidase [Turicibacter sp. TA25]MCU7210185.1 prepilin peptidase [Turicibacter sp. 1E2]BEH91768.1 type 4 prepilin-like proteins leader peptide-processing enzyme [Turicibacter sp. TC023]
MNYNIYVLTFIIGTILGSFYHVVGYRMPLQLNWMNSRSFCQHCHTSLTGFDLVPVVSYIFLRGRCRHCQQSIPFFHLIIEILSGLLFLLPLHHYGSLGFFSGEIYIAWIFLSLLIVITVSDCYFQLILDKVLIFFFILLVAGYSFFSSCNIFYRLIEGGGTFLIFYVISIVGKFLFKKEALGGGDIKLYGLVGLVLGIRCTFISLLLSTILALIYCCIFRRGNNRTPLTFGPFIAASAYFCLFQGETFLEVYIKLFY